jgi:DNA-directed RNA polymerase specialized sigma24 family protein
VAEILACPRGTVQSRVARARVMLAQLFRSSESQHGVSSLSS